MSEKPESGETAASEKVVIKKYANRRLYNTASSSYVTLEHLADMVKEGIDFVVYDAKTGEDITRPVLTQIIFEEESSGQQSLLPVQFLRQLIGFYGNQMQAFVPSYLEMSLEAFSKSQERLRSQFATMAPGVAVKGGMGVYDEQIRQNMVLFDRAMKMFSPFAFTRPDEPTPAPPAAKPAEAAPSEDSLADLKRQLDAMREQIEKLATKN
ncbi:MAG: polyhydroxyalkonate synthesis repressor, PhaR [Caulobacter sp.]|nr:polyhydroxyalkonate synthesis repressor, PhaR [Caulobacter sp.]